MIQSIARKVEKTDPRMEIRRDESENYGKPKKDNSENHQPIPWEDTTIVSITALKNFLSNLLGVTNQEEESPLPAPLPAAEHHDPANTYLSRATNAYQSTGRAVHDKNIEDPPPITSTADTTASMVSLGEDFGEEGRTRIKQYKEDLDILEKNGVEEITLRRTLTFLDAIGQGIEDARQKI